MSGLSLVALAGVFAGCAANDVSSSGELVASAPVIAVEAPPAATTVAASPPMASAAPARRDPPKREASGCQRGPIEFPAATNEERQRLIDRFVRENGADAESTHADPTGRYVTVTRLHLGPALVTVPTLSEAAREASARSFLKLNADMLGITSSEVDGLKRAEESWSPRTEIRLRSSKLVPGYEKLGLLRNIDFRLDVTPGAVVVGLNSDFRVPQIDLCTKPLLDASDPRVRGALIGREGVTWTMHGERESLGLATERDVGNPKLKVHVSVDPRDRHVTFTLAYAVPFFAGTFNAIIDANTAEVVEVIPNYRS